VTLTFSKVNHEVGASTKVRITDKKTGEIKSYDSMKDAGKALGLHVGHCSNARIVNKAGDHHTVEFPNRATLYPPRNYGYPKKTVKNGQVVLVYPNERGVFSSDESDEDCIAETVEIDDSDIEEEPEDNVRMEYIRHRMMRSGRYPSPS